MRRIRYGVAMSLDGFIAGPQGEYDWIPMDPDMDFAAMMAEFDTYLMGRKTYEVAAGGPMGFGSSTVWVFSRTMKPEEHGSVTVVSEHVEERLTELRARPGKDIALFGGGELFRSLLELGQVDTVEVALVPVLLGGGIPLLPSPATRSLLALESQEHYPKTGTVLLRYAIDRSAAPSKRTLGGSRPKKARG